MAQSGPQIKFPIALHQFNGGLVDDIREALSNKFGLSKHFDIYSNPLRLTPYRSTTAEADATSAAHLKTFNLQDFKLGKSGKMYALGNDGSGHPQVYEKADPTTGVWAPSTTGAGANALINGSFLEFGTTNAWWMFSGTQKISKYATGSNTFIDTVATISAAIITVAQSIVGADGNMYMFYNNQVVRVNPNGTVTDQVLTCLPSDMRIQCVVQWGSYLGICMAYGTSATAAPVGVSKMFVWDMVTTTTVNDVIDLGEGAVMVAGNIEGMVVTVSNKFMETPSGLTSLAIGQGSIVVRVWNGANAKVMKEIVTNQVVTLGRFIRNVVVKDNKMYFVCSLPLAPDSTSTESTYNLGIWAFGRKNSSLPFALTLDYIEEGVDTANYKINSFGNAGNYWFINHSADGSVTKTDNVANYTFTSIYETPIINFVYGLRHRLIPDPRSVKKLIGLTLEFDPAPANGIARLYYRVDNQTAWTQIFKYTAAAGDIFHSAINIENLTVGGDTVTLTVASPCVVTLAAHKLVAGQIIRFTTTGALPTGIQAGLNYYVISTGLTANTFEFSATSGGSAVNTSGSQSGTHILDRSYPLPNYKELQLRIESTAGIIPIGWSAEFSTEQQDIYE